jgi:hypothetical protein
MWRLRATSILSSEYDTNDHTTVTTLPTEGGDSADNDRHEELLQLWLDAGNLDAAETEAELIAEQERKLAARSRVDRARETSGTVHPSLPEPIPTTQLPDNYEKLDDEVMLALGRSPDADAAIRRLKAAALHRDTISAEYSA